MFSSAFTISKRENKVPITRQMISFMKSLLGGCLVNTANFSQLLDDIKAGVNTQGGATAPTAVDLANTFLGTNNFCTGDHPEYNLFAGVPGGPGVSGVPLSIAGNRLPFVPELTAGIGIQYSFDLGSAWTFTPRLDYRLQGDIYSDLFNNEDNRVKSYNVGNATFAFVNEESQISIQAYIKNITDDDTITGASLGSGAILGNPRTIVVLDPRTYGISVTKDF